MVGERNKFVLRGVSDGQKEGKGRDEGVEMNPRLSPAPFALAFTLILNRMCPVG